MIEIQDLENIFDVLNLTQGTFENAYNLFSKYYENDNFKHCFAIYRLLQNKVQIIYKGINIRLKVYCNLFDL